jgi:hypothetical protein
LFFTIDRALFSQGAIDTAYLNNIWTICTDQHTFYQSNIDDVEATEESVWYQNLSEIDKILWKDSVTYSLQIGDKYNKVKVSIGVTHTAYEAFHYLSSPLKIVLENILNDAHFLHAIFRCFRQDTKTILTHINNRWLQFTMGGGSSIGQVIQAEMNSFISPLFIKEKHEYLRFFVLLDSDRKYPNEPLKQGAVNLVAFLNEKNVPFHILEKREMENYLPDASFDDITQNRPFIDAYLRLTPEQKDYFDLEKGFPNKKFDDLSSDEMKQLFRTVNDHDKSIFRLGDLKKFTNSGQEDFKSECPTLFKSKTVTKAALIARTEKQINPNELEDIIQKIRELL